MATKDEQKLEIRITDRGEWLTAEVEDRQGNLLGAETAPVVEGAAFDMRAAVIRAAVEGALTTLAASTQQDKETS